MIGKRVKTFEEFKDKILQLRDENLFRDKLEQYTNNYKKVLLSEDEYFSQFRDRMNRIL